MSTVPAQPPTVAVVSPPGLIRGRIIAALGEDEVVVSAASVAMVRGGSEAPGLVVLAGGPESPPLLTALAECTGRWPGAVVVVVCDLERDRAGAPERLLRGGTAGIVALDDLDRALVATVAAVRAGQTCVPRALRSRLAPPSLSRRERQALGLVVMGLSNGEIAAQLHLTESTVKSHLTGAYRKLGVASRAEAVERLLDPVAGLGPGVLSVSASGPA